MSPIEFASYLGEPMISRRIVIPIIVCGAYCLLLAQSFPASRDPLKWPFAQHSCWNMPIGSDAAYAPAGIKANTGTQWRPDQDIIVMKPKARMTKIYFSSAGWSGGNRCAANENKPRFSVPIPDSFVIGNEKSNASAAFLDSNGRMVKQCQPFARCKPFDSGTSHFFFDKPVLSYGVLYDFHDMDIRDSTGEIGGHWGSKLSNLGGTIRVGEFTAGVIRHAMKVNLSSHIYYYYDFNCSARNKDSCSFRWPAVSVDHYAYDKTDKDWYAGTNNVFIIGALLALKPTFNLDTLQTIPGKIIAKAFQDYGAYVSDDAACDCWALILERGPDGSVIDEVKSRYNATISLTPHTDEFWKDMVKVFENLHIITNNGPQNIGGGGTPRQPLAPPFIGTGISGDHGRVRQGGTSLQKIALGLGQRNTRIKADFSGHIYTLRGEKAAARYGSRGTSIAGLPPGVYVIKAK